MHQEIISNSSSACEFEDNVVVIKTSRAIEIIEEAIDQTRRDVVEEIFKYIAGEIVKARVSADLRRGGGTGKVKLEIEEYKDIFNNLIEKLKQE